MNRKAPTHYELVSGETSTIRAAKYYLAGPMSGFTDFNYSWFELAAKQLRDRNYEIVSPHELFPEEDATIRGNKKASFYMRRALAALLDCDGIVMLPGWRKSMGAMLEHQVAVAAGLQVYYFDPTELYYPYEMP